MGLKYLAQPSGVLAINAFPLFDNVVRQRTRTLAGPPGNMLTDSLVLSAPGQ
jgi:hypothetical protein